MPLDAITYLTRILYKAPSDETWGEHEIDYILFVHRDVETTPNPNEVMNCRYVDQQELRELLRDGESKITPWFRLISEAFLFQWWDSLNDLSSFVDTATIHRLT